MPGFSGVAIGRRAPAGHILAEVLDPAMLVPVAEGERGELWPSSAPVRRAMAPARAVSTESRHEQNRADRPQFRQLGWGAE
jgi:hypothetical protein